MDGRRECEMAQRAASVIVLFNLSSIPLICRWYGIVVACFIPCDDINIEVWFDRYSGALSEWKIRGVCPCLVWMYVIIRCTVYAILYTSGTWELLLIGIIIPKRVRSSIKDIIWLCPWYEAGQMVPLVSLSICPPGLCVWVRAEWNCVRDRLPLKHDEHVMMSASDTLSADRAWDMFFAAMF